MISQIKELEVSIQIQIADKFKLTFPYSGQIDILDAQLMLAEADQLFNHRVSWQVEGLDPLDVIIEECWAPPRAKKEFMTRFEELYDGKIDWFNYQSLGSSNPVCCYSSNNLSNKPQR